MVDAAKYVTDTGQPAIFIIGEVNKKWYDSLPKDLQQILDRDAAAQSHAINPFAVTEVKQAEASYTSGGGHLIKLLPTEQAEMMKTLGSVGTDVSKRDPAIAAAYKVVTDAAARTRQSPTQ
jgi:TRAP-type C4-dicarboxylate transport system substrate-binding protein